MNKQAIRDSKDRSIHEPYHPELAYPQAEEESWGQDKRFTFADVEKAFLAGVNSQGRFSLPSKKFQVYCGLEGIDPVASQG